LEHVRIDEGIKRVRKSVPKRRNPETGAVQAIPDGLKPEEVLKRYLSEETTSKIAQSYGVTRKSLVAWLRDVAPDEWRRVQLIRAHDRKEMGNEGLEEASDAISLARSREIVRSAQWELQALDVDYQPKQHVEHSGTILVSHALADISQRRLASYPQPDTPALPNKEADITQVIDNKDITI